MNIKGQKKPAVWKTFAQKIYPKNVNRRISNNKEKITNSWL